MSEENISEVARKLELLKLRFKEKAANDIGLVRQTVENIRRGRFGPNDVAAAYHSLHRLAGSAGTFGYTTLGEEARALEVTLKPLAESSGELAPGQVQQVVDLTFVSRVTDLADHFSSDQAASQSTGSALLPVITEAATDAVVLVVHSNPEQAQSLVEGLELHGFVPVALPSLERAVEYGLSGVSALVVKDAKMLGEGAALDSVADKPPIVCVGAGDSFDERYALAQRGVDGFLCEPVDVPALADNMND